MPIVISTVVTPSFTVQNVLDRARIPLNDTAKVRYPDTTLLTYFNEFLLVLRKRRPDLFVGRFSALPGSLAVGATIPFPDEYEPAAADYVTARAELIDDEFSDNGRVVNLLGLVEKAILAL